MSAIRQRRAAAAAADSPAYIERRREIRVAAGDVFREKGYHATNLIDVAKRTGVDRASLYYYVGSKDDLFREVVAEAVASNLADASGVKGLDEGPAVKLERAIQLLMESFEQHYPYLQVFVQENTFKLGRGPNTEAWAPILRQAEEYFEIVTDIVAQGLECGELRSELPAAVISKSIIGMINSLHSWYRPDGLLDGAQVGSGLARIVLFGLGTKRRASPRRPKAEPRV